MMNASFQFITSLFMLYNTVLCMFRSIRECTHTSAMNDTRIASRSCILTSFVWDWFNVVEYQHICCCCQRVVVFLFLFSLLLKRRRKQSLTMYDSNLEIIYTWMHCKTHKHTNTVSRIILRFWRQVEKILHEIITMRFMLFFTTFFFFPIDCVIVITKWKQKSCFYIEVVVRILLSLLLSNSFPCVLPILFLFQAQRFFFTLFSSSGNEK